MIRLKLLSGLLLLCSVVIFMPVPVAAQPSVPAPFTQVACAENVPFFGFPTWDSCLRKKYGELKIGDLNDVWLIVFPIVESIIRATGYIAVGFIIWGGIKYTKSQGDPKNTAAARTTILNAVIGMIICILSVVIVRFVAGNFR